MHSFEIRHALVRLGRFLSRIDNQKNSREIEELVNLINTSEQYNPWFTPSNVRLALQSIGWALDEKKIDRWVSAYPALTDEGRVPKKIGVVMAGNIPAVGFHDMICVLITGNRFIGKLSSKDDRLLPGIKKIFCSIDKGFDKMIEFTDQKLEDFDAIIATGSSNSARYFRYYFSGYPHIIRKNRNSIAVINGNETDQDLELLGKDVFSYFGLGCRNVSSLLLPRGYDPATLFPFWRKYCHLKEHSRYMNNFDYHKAICLVNGDEHIDNEFVILRQSSNIASPVAVLYFDFYDNPDHLENIIAEKVDDIQCIVSDPGFYTGAVPFGQSQNPELWDYADGIDTVSFLLNDPE